MPNQKTEEHKMGKKHQARMKVLEQLDALDKEAGITFKTTDKESFANLFEESSQQTNFQVGDVVPATVIEIQSDFVLVDINYKSEGLIPIHEFKTGNGSLSIKTNDKIQDKGIHEF